MTRLAVDEIGSANVAAFLDMLAFSEGTDNGKQRTNNEGYDVMVGGGLIASLADHPRKLIDLPRYKLKSSAAGRYQFIRRTWDRFAQKLGVKDFSPASQDRVCIEQLRECGAYALIRAGRFDEAIAKAAPIWASLPGSTAGQRVNSTPTLRNVYVAKGGKLGAYA